MLIYYIFLSICLFFASVRQTRKNSGLFTILLTLFFFVIFAFRDLTVGVDTISYYNNFLDSKSEDFDLFVFEPGRYVLNNIFISLGLDFRCLLFCVGLFIVIQTSLFIYKYSYNSSLSYFFFITIGMFSFYLSGLRQTIAITFILLVYDLCFKNKFFKASVVILIASTFHFTSLVCFVVLISFLIKKITIKMLPVFLIIPLVILMLTPILQNLILNKMTIVKYISHLEESSSDINVIAYFVIPYSLFIFSTYLLYKVLKYNVGYKNYPFYFSCLLYASFAALSFSFPMISRFSYYFSLPMIIFICNNIVRIKKFPIFRKDILVLSIILCCIGYFVLSTIGGTFGIDKFKFVL